ncbi:hypothetical protein DV738_g201, partial [Chaetothyriales sp. CBS 135597]
MVLNGGLEALDKSDADSNTLIWHAASILGVDLNLTETQTQTQTQTDVAEHNFTFRQQWVLRWITRKIHSELQSTGRTDGPDDIANCSYLSNPRLWQLLVRVMQPIPDNTCAEILIERKFVASLDQAIRLILRSSSINTSGSVVAINGEEGAPPKRRRLSPQTDGVSRDGRAALHDLSLGVLRAAYAIAAIIGREDEAVDSDPSRSTMAWFQSAKDSSSILSAALQLTYRSAVTAAAEPSINEAFRHLGQLCSFWDRRPFASSESSRNEEIALFYQRCLEPCLQLLRLIQTTVEVDNIRETREALERLVAFNAVLPLRKNFFDKFAKAWKSQDRNVSWKTVVKVYNSFSHIIDNAPPQSATSASKMISVSWAQNASTLYDIAIRLVPKSDLKKRQLEQPWLDALLMFLSYLACPRLTKFEVVDSQIELVDPAIPSELMDWPQVIHDLLLIARRHMHRPSAQALSSLALSILTWDAIERPWPSIAGLVDLDVDVLVSNSGLVTTNFALDALSRKLEVSSVNLEDYTIILDQIIKPMLHGSARARALRQFITRWAQHLTEALRKSAVGLPQAEEWTAVLVWQDEELFKEFGATFRLHGTAGLAKDLLSALQEDLQGLPGRVGSTLSTFSNVAIANTVVESLPSTDIAVDPEMEKAIVDYSMAALQKRSDYQGQRWRLWKLIRSISEGSSISELSSNISNVGGGIKSASISNLSKGLSSEDLANLPVPEYREILERFSCIASAAAAMTLETPEQSLAEEIAGLQLLLKSDIAPTLKSDIDLWNGRLEDLHHLSKLFSACLGVILARPRLFKLLPSLAEEVGHLCTNSPEDSLLYQPFVEAVSEFGDLQTSGSVVGAWLAIEGFAAADLSVLRKLWQDLTRVKCSKAQYQALGDKAMRLLESFGGRIKVEALAYLSTIMERISSTHPVSYTRPEAWMDWLKLLDVFETDYQGALTKDHLHAAVKFRKILYRLWERCQSAQVVQRIVQDLSSRMKTDSEDSELPRPLSPFIALQAVLPSLLATAKELKETELIIRQFTNTALENLRQLTVDPRQSKEPTEDWLVQVNFTLETVLEAIRLLPNLDKIEMRGDVLQLQEHFRACEENLSTLDLLANHRLGRRSASKFSRLLSMICNPTVSAAKSSRKRHNNELNDEIKRVKALAGQHMQYLVMEYARCTLDGEIQVEVKEKLMPGMTRQPSWQSIMQEMPQAVGLGEWLDDNSPSDNATYYENPRFKSSRNRPQGTNGSDPYGTEGFTPGQPKPPGSLYTKSLVIAKTLEENVDWVLDESLDGLRRMVYVVDDPSAPLTVPKNKGHEVMVYLTYIIDNYYDLTDISIFMHAHQFAWHDNDLLNNDGLEMVRRLSSERVTRQGYMNLRCHWEPGCPDWMHPGTVVEDINKEEETVIAQAWAELFPDKPIPALLAQPCCAQFALSRERIQARELEQYKFWREWLLRTPMSDKISGRVWEYLWQVVFADRAVECPNQWTCYCDGYGVCFENEKEFDYWFELRWLRHELAEELGQWLERIAGFEDTKPARITEIQSEMVRLEGMMEDARMSAVSTALAGAVVLKAVAQRPNFYSATVYLSQSSANLFILTNLVFMLACSLLFALQKLLYGPLRPIEVEQLYERGWFAVTETCLAMTIFRGEIGPWFLAMFFALLAAKVWQWIGEGRVEVLEQQPPRNPRLFHTRLALSLGLSVVFDLTMLEYVVKQVMRMARPDMMVMFGFEFAVLSIMSLSTAARYTLALVEISIVRNQKRNRVAEMQRERVETAKRHIQEAETWEQESRDRPAADEITQQDSNEHVERLTLEQAQEELRRAQEPIDDNEVDVEGWEARGRYLFYLDLATDFFKLVIYLSFFLILLIFYGLPLHIMRDVFLTTRSFFKRISDFIKYRTATRDMNERFPDATEQDIAGGDPDAPGAQAAQRPQGQGARVFQFGPLRIGIGAGRGNHMLEDLQQQLHNGRPEQANPTDRNQPRQYGFGIRWDGLPRRTDRRQDRGSVRDQLDRVEQQIQEEMQALSQNTREYAALRHMQLELDRARAGRNASTRPAASAADIPSPAPNTVPMPVPQRLHIPPAMFSDMPGQAQQPGPPANPSPRPQEGVSGVERESTIATQQNIHRGSAPTERPAENAWPSPHYPFQIGQESTRPQTNEERTLDWQRTPSHDNGLTGQDPRDRVGDSVRERYGSGLPSLRMQTSPQVINNAAAAAATNGAVTGTPSSSTLPHVEQANSVRNRHDEHKEGDSTPVHAIPTRSFGQPSPVTPQPLPMWGAATGLNGYEGSRRPQQPAQAIRGETASPSQAGEDARSKQATVEDVDEQARQ